MSDAIQFEKKGKPTVVLSYDTFEQAARSHAEAANIPNIPIVVIQHWEYNFSKEDARKEMDGIADAVLSKLVRE